MQTDNSNKKQLNPFAFPPETNVRFTLLVIAGLMLTYNIAYAISELLVSYDTVRDINPILDAIIRAGQLLDLDSQSELIAAGVMLSSLILPVGITIAVVTLAWVIYRTHPARIRRRKNLELLQQDTDPTLHRQIQKLTSLAEVSTPPSIELGKGIHSQNGQAFGFEKQYVIGFGGGIRLLLRKAPQAFRAIFFHEMAHIANRDVRRTYFTQALWNSIIAVYILFGIALGGLLIRDYFLVPLRDGIASVDWGPMLTVRFPAILLLILQVGSTLVVSATIRASVLRIRENYADWRTAIWGAGNSLFNILRNEAARKNRGHRKNPLHFHPSAKQRMSVLDDSKTLFRIPLDLSFQVGFLLGLTISNGVTYLSILSTSLGLVTLSIVPPLIDLAAEKASLPLAIMARVIAQFSAPIGLALFSIPFIIIVGYLASGLSLQIQREAVAGITDPNVGGYFRLWVIAVLSALGLETGLLFQPFSSFWPSGAINIFLDLILFGGTIVFTWLCLAYALFFGKRVLGSHFHKSPPVWKRRLLTLCFTVILGGFYLPLMVERIFFVNSSDPLNQQIFRNFIINGLIIALLLYIIVFSTTWMLFQIRRFAHTPLCPHCKTVTHQEYSVGKNCNKCEQALAPWLIIKSISVNHSFT